MVAESVSGMIREYEPSAVVVARMVVAWSVTIASAIGRSVEPSCTMPESVISPAAIPVIKLRAGTKTSTVNLIDMASPYWYVVS